MRDTQFMVSFVASVEVLGGLHELRCTVCPCADRPPVLMWVEAEKPVIVCALGPPFWDAVQHQLDRGGPARDQFEIALANAQIPFMAEAAE